MEEREIRNARIATNIPWNTVASAPPALQAELSNYTTAIGTTRSQNWPNKCNITKSTPINTNVSYNPRQCAFCKKFGKQVQTYITMRETLNDVNNQIQPSLNNIIDCGRVPNGQENKDKDFYIAQWIDQVSGMKEAYHLCIKACSIWKDIYAATEKRSNNMKDRYRFLHVQNWNKQWRLVLPSIFNGKGRNLLKIAIAKAHAATAHGGIEKTIKALTNKFECQSFSCLISEYVGSCNICQNTKYAQRGPIGYITKLYVPVIPCSNITMDFLKLSAVFTKCSVLYTNIPVGQDHIICISQL